MILVMEEQYIHSDEPAPTDLLLVVHNRNFPGPVPGVLIGVRPKGSTGRTPHVVLARGEVAAVAAMLQDFLTRTV